MRGVACAAVCVSLLACDRAGPPSAPPQPTAPSQPTSPPQATAPAAWRPIATDALCTTSGTLTPRGATGFAIDAPTFRAVTGRASDARAQLRFTYLGATATTRALGSGNVRNQLGLKLRAADPCNLVYVMWRIEPDAKLVVSIKRNAGQRTSAECGNRGYQNMKARSQAALPTLAVGSSHTLRAEMSGAALAVFVDDARVWEGDLGADVLALEGAIGLRTDNVRLDGVLFGSGSSAPAACGAKDEVE